VLCGQGVLAEETAKGGKDRAACLACAKQYAIKVHSAKKTLSLMPVSCVPCWQDVFRWSWWRHEDTLRWLAVVFAAEEGWISVIWANQALLVTAGNAAGSGDKLRGC